MAFDGDPTCLRWVTDAHRGAPAATGTPDITLTLARSDESMHGPDTPTATAGHLSFWGWRAEFDGTRCTARISNEFAGERGAKRVASLTRIVLGQWLALRGALSFHGAAVVQDGRAWLLVGPRCAGKTTAATRWAWERVLADDHVIVMPGPEGFLAYGTPYTGREGTAWSPEPAPLAAICILEQAASGSFAPQSRSEAFPALVRQVISIGEGRRSSQRVLEALDTLTKQVPVVRLAFALDSDLPAIVERAA